MQCMSGWHSIYAMFRGGLQEGSSPSCWISRFKPAMSWPAIFWRALSPAAFARAASALVSAHSSATWTQYLYSAHPLEQSSHQLALPQAKLCVPWHGPRQRLCHLGTHLDIAMTVHLIANSLKHSQHQAAVTKKSGSVADTASACPYRLCGGRANSIFSAASLQWYDIYRSQMQRQNDVPEASSARGAWPPSHALLFAAQSL